MLRIFEMYVAISGDNSYRWVVFISCQCTDHVNIRQSKPDMNNKRVNIR